MKPLPFHRTSSGEEETSSHPFSSQQHKEGEGYNPKWEQDLPLRPLKVAVIREEFVALTGDPFLAVVLNQLLYWTLRVKDFDLLLEEEKSFNPDCNVSPRHGWIYKTADHLTEETMLRVSRSTMRRYLNSLVENGWVDERENPRDQLQPAKAGGLK